MRTTGAVQVVLGEGEPGILRFVLEAEGFHVVGQARGEAELRRVLDVTHPSVIVLDAGISATAALDARDRAGGAQLVVVWPNGVRTTVASERVDPTTAMHDLGSAVRRAAERATASLDDDVVTLPESTPVDHDPRPLTLVADAATAGTSARRRGSRRLLTLVGACVLALTASAAAAFVVPRTLDLFERRGTPHAPSLASPAPSPAAVDDRSQPDPATPSSGSARGTCERPDTPQQRDPGERGRGCGQARGQGRGSNGPNGNAGGRGASGSSGERSEPGTNGEANGDGQPDANGGGAAGGSNGNGANDDVEGQIGSDVTDDGGGGNGKGRG